MSQSFPGILFQMFPARRNVFRKYSRQSNFITRQVLWKEAQKLQQSPYCQCFRTHRIWTSLWVDTFIVTEFRAQIPCVITHVSAFWLQCLRSECHVYESRSVICLQGGWLATGRVSRIPPPLLSLPPSPTPQLPRYFPALEPQPQSSIDSHWLSLTSCSTF